MARRTAGAAGTAAGHVDAWHLSPGPIVPIHGGESVMFYNGATRSAQWRIGWATFDAEFQHVVERCVEPLIRPEPERGAGSDIAFAASAVLARACVWLYYSQSDQALRRALLKETRSAGDLP